MTGVAPTSISPANVRPGWRRDRDGEQQQLLTPRIAVISRAKQRKCVKQSEPADLFWSAGSLSHGVRPFHLNMPRHLCIGSRTRRQILAGQITAPPLNGGSLYGKGRRSRYEDIMNNTSFSNLFAGGMLHNFSVRNAKGVIAVIQAPDLEIATARVPIIARVIEGGIATPVTLARHEGTVRCCWFADSYFLTSET